MENKHETETIESIDGSPENQVEALLADIQGALEEDSETHESFFNEFGDFTIAISLGGGQETLDRFMEKQKLSQDLNLIARYLISQIKPEGRQHLACCFTGHRPKKVAWLADEEDYRTCRLRYTVQALVKELALNGIRRFIAGNAEGFDTIAAEAVMDCNSEFEDMKAIEVLPEDWEPVELEIAIPFEGHNAHDQRSANVRDRAMLAHVVSESKNRAQAFFERNEYMVNHSDIVVALLDNKEADSETGGTQRTIAYAKQQGKPVITIYTRWLEDGWPNAGGIDLALPPDWIDALSAAE